MFMSIENCLEYCNNAKKYKSYNSGESEKTEWHLLQVPPLEQVGRLEDLLIRNTVLPDRILEPTTKILS
jgi:hypothetical protein